MSDLLSHDVLVISQKAKVIEMTNEYRVFDDAGNQIGTIREVEQSTTKKAVRLFSGVDQFLTHKLGVFDSDGQQVLMLERPAKLMKSKIKVSDADGTSAARSCRTTSSARSTSPSSMAGATGSARSMARTGCRGTSPSTTAPAWEVGRITKQWAGILKEGYTTADTYILQIEAEVSPTSGC